MRLIEGPLVRRLRDSTVYQTEVGLYDAPAIEGLDELGMRILDAYLPQYRDAIETKRRHARRLREELEPLGFRFQKDTGGHLYTALGARIPPGVDRDALVRHLGSRGVNAFTLWGDPLGVSAVAQQLWNTDPAALPVTAMLKSELVHFPISRFLGDRDLRRIVSACAEFVAEQPA
jgi:dTDP-4-amino-4,6-dideoxygalactose transaminase